MGGGIPARDSERSERVGGRVELEPECFLIAHLPHISRYVPQTQMETPYRNRSITSGIFLWQFRT